jgi:P-type conjugative transfer protein TrbJ
MNSDNVVRECVTGPQTQARSPESATPSTASLCIAAQWPRRERRLCRWGRVPWILVVLAALTLQAPSSGHASIFGEDTAVLSAILSQNIAQLAQMVQTVSNLYSQIRQLTTMIEQSDTMLRTVKDPTDVLRVLRYSQALLRKEGAIERNVRLLEYKLKVVDDDRAKVFPDMESVPTHEFQAKAQTWNDALKESSMVAMRAQTSVDTVEERLDQVTKLQHDSEGAEGIVGQLQIVVKELAVLHTDLTAIEQNLAYGERVTATMAGVQAAEEDRATEESRRMLKNYTSRGPTPRRLEELP